MLSSTAPEQGLSLERPEGNQIRLLAWIVAITGCVLLLAAVKYYPESAAGKVSLFQHFLFSFWGDIKRQILGLFFGIPQESLAGEVTSSEWNYCALVPLIVGWLVWRLMPELQATPVQGENAGFWILSGGLLFYTLGFLVEEFYAGIVAMEIIYAGLIVLFLGWPIMRRLAYPWALLMFMWPYEVLAESALHLRLVMATLSHDVLELLGVSNIVQGTALYSAPGAAAPFALDVADPCSGIRSLFALLMVAAVYGFLSLSKLWQQLLIFVLAIPLAVLGNLARLVLLALATIHFGQKFAIGTDNEPSWFHEAVGYLVYLIDLGGMLFAGWLLGRFSPASSQAKAPAAPVASKQEIESPFLLKKTLFTLAAFTLTLLICVLAPSVREGPSGVTLNLPDQLGPLLSHSEKISPAELTLLADTTFARKSYGPPGSEPLERIVCSIVQSGSVPRTLHRPERCLPAQGFTIDGNKIVTIPLQSGHTLDARFYLLEQSAWLKNGQRLTLKSDFLYWYVGDGIAGPYRWQNFFKTNWDLLFHRVSQRWSYVYVMGRNLDNLKPGGRTEEQTLNLLEAFIRESAPYFMRSEMPPDSGP